MLGGHLDSTAAALGAIALLALAEETRIWPFTNPDNYILLRENGGEDLAGDDITIEDGILKLVPDVTAINQDTTDELNTGTAYRARPTMNPNTDRKANEAISQCVRNTWR